MYYIMPHTVGHGLNEIYFYSLRLGVSNKNMKKFNLKRERPERSKKRKLVVPKGTKLIPLRNRVLPETKRQIEEEAKDLGISESLYLNAIIETRSLRKIKKLLDGK